MTLDDKNTLCLFLQGTALDVGAAMRRLGIEGNITVIGAEIEDTVQRCRVCQKWADADVMENRRCPRCDLILNPENQSEE